MRLQFEARHGSYPRSNPRHRPPLCQTSQYYRGLDLSKTESNTLNLFSCVIKNSTNESNLPHLDRNFFLCIQGSRDIYTFLSHFYTSLHFGMVNLHIHRHLQTPSEGTVSGSILSAQQLLSVPF